MLKMTAFMLVFHVLLAMEIRILSLVPHSWVGDVLAVSLFIFILCTPFVAASLVTRVYDHLSNMLVGKTADPVARLLRDGHEHHVNVKEIQVGDILLVELGDILAADGILHENHNLIFDEPTTTTGRLSAATKDPQQRYVLASSKFLSGSGFVLVTAVGSNLFLNKVSSKQYVSSTEIWMSRTLFNFGLAGFVSGFLIYAVTWIAQLPFQTHRSFNAGGPYKEDNPYLVSIINQTMSVVSVTALASVRDAFFISALALLGLSVSCLESLQVWVTNIVPTYCVCICSFVVGANFMVASTDLVFQDPAPMEWWHIPTSLLDVSVISVDSVSVIGLLKYVPLFMLFVI